jgi:hypothetical protein
MDPTPDPVAPALPATPTTISAERAAANKGDFSALNNAHLAARRGTPLARVEVKAEAPAKAPEPPEAPAAPAPPALSKRQQETNDRVREAAERATATLREENARLKVQLAAHQPAPAPVPAAPAAPETKVAEWKRFAQMPDAPKLADFDSVEEHTAAMALFIADTRHEEHTAADRQRTETDELTAAQRARVGRFVEQLDASKAADPEFVTKLTPEVKALKPFGALAPGELGGPRNIIAEQVYDSPIAPAVLLHFSQHPEALVALETPPPHIAALPPALRVKAHIQWIVREFGKLEGSLESASPAASTDRPAQPSTITAAPPPPDTVTRAGSTTDPKASALKRGDFDAFNRLELAERAAKRAHA